MAVAVNTNRLLEQLKGDEGFVAKAMWDLKQWTYGYGCRAPGEGAVITEPEAAKLVIDHMVTAIGHFNSIFAGHLSKFNDVRAEAFINMIFNMGPGKRGNPKVGGMQSFVNTLGLIFNNTTVPWTRVADNLKQSLWFREVEHSGDPDGPGPVEGRGERIIRQIRTGTYSK